MNNLLFTIFVGIDVAKKKFDAACLVGGKYKHKTFANQEDGYTAFMTWLSGLCADNKPLVCMESTGAYSLPIADFLADQGLAVSMVNPAKIHNFAKSELSKAKTDKADAKLIARYAAILHPPLWTPPPFAIRTLQALVRRAEQLKELIQMERNRLDTADEAAIGSINTVLATLESELKATLQKIRDHIGNDPDLKRRAELLNSIPGIGEASTAHLLVALSEHHQFTDAKQVVAYAGLAPRLRESGQWRGSTHIAKTGHAELRKALYMPALSASRFNPLIKPFKQRLKANGKHGKAIACAIMRKLIHIAFAVLKSGKPFDPNFAA